MKRKMTAMVIAGIILILVSCGGKKVFEEKKEIQKTASPSTLSMRSDLNTGEAPSYGLTEMEDAEAPESGKDSLGFSFIPQTKKELIRGRYLEYIVNLNYRTTNFALSRLELLSIIEKYGFLASSGANAEISASMSVQASIKAESLYIVIKELEKIGALVSENITVVDHTGERVWTGIKAAREKIRIDRKNRAMGQITAAKKTWEQVEASLEASEDAADQAEYQEWSLNDLVSWAKFSISLQGPERLEKIQVPDYRKAGIFLVNLLIQLSYYLVTASPLIIIAGILFWKRRAITALFQKKNKKP